ncbi:DUF4389 domain-containing protein [Mycobacterium deserti]|uniref:DUF4389 domain-containing protein n=1 Tax=Mycobacterium deserti TaxID=2978347 RepID=A0ABT2M9I0_9MYCO|nr:DUF4389 domain-containing protein [Mycobacterium deserti]MCT7657825.1 DUF4389 domain-containing protein [Mycobacterium deserti]
MAHSEGSSAYPVRIQGDFDESVSRWLWLLKWFLAIPHYIALLFLNFAFVLVTVVAGFAILITGRYPRPLFNFNVGVMRWSWRVRFYAYSTLGTDSYPPFTLGETNYKADLAVEYPERLSRGLVLVKWWLLALPHLLIVSAMLSGGVRMLNLGNGRIVVVPLLTLLVLVAAMGLLFTGRYPRGLFDFVVGINRWMYRVRAYAALMTDDYPPFRLDQGPREKCQAPAATVEVQEAPAATSDSTEATRDEPAAAQH